MSASSDEPLVNCVMLVTWPKRRAMIQEALASFVCQDYAGRCLTVVNDGAPCRLSAAFHERWSGQVVQMAAGTSIGEKRNAAAAAVAAASHIASFDDDDFSMPSRLTANLVRRRRHRRAHAARSSAPPAGRHN
jgi:hypothetical protein